MIDKEDKLPVKRQCEILKLSRSGIYYTPVPLSANFINGNIGVMIDALASHYQAELLNKQG